MFYFLYLHFSKFSPIPNPNSDSGDGMSQAEPLINFLLYFYGKISRVLFQEAALLTFEWMSVSPLQPFVSTPRLFRDALVNTDFLQRTFRDSPDCIRLISARNNKCEIQTHWRSDD